MDKHEMDWCNMKQIKCPNCGADEFYIKDGCKVCKYCLSKFEIDANQIEDESGENEADKISYKFDELYEEENEYDNTEYFDRKAVHNIANRTSQVSSKCKETPASKPIGKNYRVADTAYRVLELVYYAVFWIFSLFVFGLSVGAGNEDNGRLSQIILILTAILMNPTVNYYINKHLFRFPKWTSIVIMVVGTLFGFAVYPGV